LAHCEAALSLQTAESDHQIGAFENFHQPVEDTFVVLRPGPKVFFEYELRFIDRLKSQLLVSHFFHPIKQMRRGSGEREIKPLLRNIPAFLTQLINFLLQCGNSQGAIAADYWFYAGGTSKWAACLTRRLTKVDALAVELQPVDDLVDHVVPGAY